MSRYIYQGTFRDGLGNIISSGTILVYLAGTSTAATVYEDDSTVTSVNSVTSDSSGHFEFWVDDSDYLTTQKFKLTLRKGGFTDSTYDDIVIFPLQGATGAQGPQGDKGDTGAKITSAAWSTNDLVFTLDDASTVSIVNAKTDLKGNTGEGVPIGGTTGQMLVKSSSTNYDTEWSDNLAGPPIRQTTRRGKTNYNGRPDFLWGGNYDFASMKEDYLSNAIMTGTPTSAHEADKVFDGSDSTYWHSAESGAGVNGVSYIGLKNIKRNVKAIKFLTYGATANSITSVKVQYSTDLVTWSDIQTTTVTSSATSHWEEFTVAEYASGDAGLHAIRLLANSATGSSAWAFYTLVLLYDTNLDVCTTGNTIKYDEQVSYEATKAFDNHNGGATWYASSTNMSTGNQYLGQSGLTSAVKAIRIFNHSSATYMPKEVRLSWKQNVGDSWIDLATVALDMTVSVWQTVVVPSYYPSGSHYFAIRPTTNCAAQVLAIVQMELYTSFSDLNITASATDPLTVSFANGLEDETEEVVANVTGAWSSLTKGRRNFLYFDKDMSTGAVTRSHSPIVPQYGYEFDKKKHSLLHFDGADASTVITDQFGHAWTVVGNGALSTTSPKFGSAKIAGTTGLCRTTAFNSFGAQPFCMEFWAYSTNWVGSTQSLFGGTTAAGVTSCLAFNYTTPSFALLLSSNGSTWDICNLTYTVTPSNSTWYKFIFEWDGYYYRMWMGTQTSDMKLIFNVKSSLGIANGGGTITSLALGGWASGGTTYPLQGGIDEFRLTIGSNRYGWSPVAEVAAFPTYDADIHYFDIPKMMMYKGDDSTGWTQVQRTFLGEVYTDAQGSTDQRNYALNGKYDTNDITTTAVTTTKAHNIGTNNPQVFLFEGLPEARTQIMSKDFTAISRNNLSWSAVAGASRLIAQRGW